MTDLVIREALSADDDTLAALKAHYVQALYYGFAPELILKLADPSTFIQQFHHWQEQDDFHMDVLLLKDVAQGYVIYGPDPADNAFGLIQEAVLDMACDSDIYAALYHHALDALASKGLPQVHQWVLKDNFRTRFLLEQYGFRLEGVRRMVDFDGQPVETTRYLYRD